MDWKRDRLLVGYMVVTLAGITTIAAGFLFGFVVLLRTIVYVSITGRLPAATTLLFQSTTPEVPPWLSVGVPLGTTIVLFGGLLVLQRWRRGMAESRFQARLRDPPDPLKRRLATLAQTADVPPPTLRVLDFDTPTAFTHGFGPRRARITVTSGLLAELDDAAIDAVLAHELSHVLNRDVAVMTLATAPVVIAEGLWTISTKDREDSDVYPTTPRRGSPPREFEGVLTGVLGVFAGIIWFVSRAISAAFARYRELAADRGAIAITGDPGAIADALETMAGTEYASADLRATAVDAFAIAPSGGIGGSWATGWQTPLDWIPTRWRRQSESVLDFHPKTRNRIARLREIESET